MDFRKFSFLSFLVNSWLSLVPLVPFPSTTLLAAPCLLRSWKAKSWRNAGRGRTDSSARNCRTASDSVACVGNLVVMVVGDFKCLFYFVQH